MTLEEFIAAARAGAFKVRGGGYRDGALYTTMVILDAADVDAVTAEAFAHDVCAVDGMTWDEASEIIARALRR